VRQPSAHPRATATGLAAGLQPMRQHHAGSTVTGSGRSFLGALMEDISNEYDLVFNEHNNEPEFKIDSTKGKIYSNKP